MPCTTIATLARNEEIQQVAVTHISVHTAIGATAVITKQSYTEQPEFSFGQIQMQDIDCALDLLIDKDGVFLRGATATTQVGTAFTLDGINQRFYTMLSTEIALLLDQVIRMWDLIPLGFSCLVADYTRVNLAPQSTTPAVPESEPAPKCDVCNNTGFSALIPGEALAPCFRCTAAHEDYTGVTNVPR